MQKLLNTRGCSRICVLPTCDRRLGAFIHNAVDIRIRGQGDLYNHHTSSESRVLCKRFRFWTYRGLAAVTPHITSLGRFAPSPSTCGEVCRRLDHLKRPCGRVLWKSSRAGSAVRLETEGGRPFNLRSDESTSWRDKSPAGACTEAIYSRMRGTSCPWWRIC